MVRLALKVANSFKVSGSVCSSIEETGAGKANDFEGKGQQGRACKASP